MYLNESVSRQRSFRWTFPFFVVFYIAIPVSEQCKPCSNAAFVASELGLHWLHMFPILKGLIICIQHQIPEMFCSFISSKSRPVKTMTLCSKRVLSRTMFRCTSNPKAPFLCRISAISCKFRSKILYICSFVYKTTAIHSAYRHGNRVARNNKHCGDDSQTYFHVRILL